MELQYGLINYNIFGMISVLAIRTLESISKIHDKALQDIYRGSLCANCDTLSKLYINENK